MKYNFPTRVVFIITGLGYGGAELQLVRLAIRLKEFGYEVGVISLISPTAYVEELLSAGVRLEHCGMSKTREFFRVGGKVKLLLRKWSPEIVVTFLYHATILGRFTKRLAGNPILISSVRSENNGGFIRDILFRLTSFSDAYITVNSENAKDKLVARRVIPNSGRVRVIPNAIVASEFVQRELNVRIQTRALLNVEADEFLWVAVGRLDVPKDYPNLIFAFKTLVDRGLSAKLKIAGQGPLLRTLKEEVEKLALDEKIDFLGLRHDIPELLNAADAFVLSSAWEGMPNVVMEALAAGVPVVATDVGGVRELVQHGSTGIIVPPRDSVALAESMKKVMAMTREKRAEMGGNGRKYIVNAYDLERVVEQWRALFDEAISVKES